MKETRESEGKEQRGRRTVPFPVVFAPEVFSPPEDAKREGRVEVRIPRSRLRRLWRRLARQNKSGN